MDTRQKHFVISEVPRIVHVSCNQYRLKMYIICNLVATTRWIHFLIALRSQIIPSLSQPRKGCGWVWSGSWHRIHSAAVLRSGQTMCQVHFLGHSLLVRYEAASLDYQLAKFRKNMMPPKRRYLSDTASCIRRIEPSATPPWTVTLRFTHLSICVRCTLINMFNLCGIWVYLMTLSAAHTIQRQTAAWLLKNELERIWKEMAVT